MVTRSQNGSLAIDVRRKFIHHEEHWERGDFRYQGLLRGLRWILSPRWTERLSGDSRLAPHRQQSMREGMDRQRNPVWSADLAQKPGNVGLDGALCEAQLESDLLVGVADGQ